MRQKLGILIIGILLFSGIMTNYYIIGNLETDARSKLEQTLIHSFQAYSKTMRVSSEERLDIVDAFSVESELIAAIASPAETEQEMNDRHFKVFEKLEVISRLRYNADIFIAVDTEGMELGRTMIANWKKNQFGTYQLIKNALNGKSGEDIWELDGRITVVNATPIRLDGKIIGALIMGNVIDEDLVKLESAITFGDFAYFSNSKIINSTLTSVKQAALSHYIQLNSSKVARVLTSKNDYFEDRVMLGDEDYIMILAPMPSLEESGLAGYLILRSEQNWLKAYPGSRNFLALITALLMLLGVSVSLLIVQKAYDAIDFILEGTHQIIVGNKDYQFASEDHYLNQIGQTINLSMAILMGKYIPEDEEEAAAMAMRGSLDNAGSASANEDRLLIETIDEKCQADISAVPDIEDEDSYYKQLFDEFIAAKKSVGDNVSQITQKSMITKLRRAEKKLLAKHGCKKVLFVVKVERNKVTLKPSPIWK